MPCFHPLTAYRGPGGRITFNEGGESGPEIKLPCGRCIGCRKRRTREWALRCMHEAQMHQHNCFVTLTYNEQHHEPSLNYRHFQDFLRSLRRTTPIRFFAAGEYGEQTKRPHWHALLFGIQFTERYPVGKDLYGSHQLEQHWPWGFSSIGELNYTTASYVASYCIKKINGPLAAEHYKRVNLATGEIFQVTPEMARMSLKPGIGKAWYQRYIREVSYARDGIVQLGGHQLKTPRYYDKILQQQDLKQYTEHETNRQLEANTRKDDNTTQRLQTKEKCEIAKQRMKRKKL